MLQQQDMGWESPVTWNPFHQEGPRNGVAEYGQEMLKKLRKTTPRNATLPYNDEREGLRHLLYISYFSRPGREESATAADLVDNVTRQRKQARISAQEASALLFPLLFEGPVYERRNVFAALQKTSSPGAILRTALRTY